MTTLPRKMVHSFPTTINCCGLFKKSQFPHLCGSYSNSYFFSESNVYAISRRHFTVCLTIFMLLHPFHSVFWAFKRAIQICMQQELMKKEDINWKRINRWGVVCKKSKGERENYYNFQNRRNGKEILPCLSLHISFGICIPGTNHFIESWEWKFMHLKICGPLFFSPSQFKWKVELFSYSILFNQFT